MLVDSIFSPLGFPTYMLNVAVFHILTLVILAKWKKSVDMKCTEN